MMEHFWLGMMIIFVSGALNGSFAIPMKYARRWQWENTWMIFSVVGVLFLPWLLAVGFVPRLGDLYHQVPTQALIYPVAFGFLWGIAQVTFGLGLSAVGTALAFTVVAGLACLSGSLVPLLALNPAGLFAPQGLLLLASIPILFLGLLLYGMAGRRREREQTAGRDEAPGVNYGFRTGLIICIFTGIVGSAWNVGFAFSGPILRRSATLGAGTLVAPYAVWALILTAGFIPNLLYCAYLLSRNKTWSLFFRTGSSKEFMLGVVMALLWLSGVAGYGVGATFVGKFGTSIGFALFVAAQIFASNGLGILTGEWKGTAPKTRRLVASAMVATLVSVMVLNLGGLF